MVLSSSVFESEHSTSLPRKIKIRQQLSRGVTAVVQGRSSSRRPIEAANIGSRGSRMSDYGGTTSIISSADRFPLRSRLRRPPTSGGGGGGDGGGGRSGSSYEAGASAHSSASSSSSGGGGGGLRSTSSIPKSASAPGDLQATCPPLARGLLGRSAGLLAEARSLTSLLRRRPSAGGSPARKCVSFSADTSFERESRTRPGRASVHEARRYRKGVLQDRHSCEVTAPATLPLSWEECLGGPRALLGAAQDGDEELVKRIVALAGKAGLGHVDVNAVDASGRTAISYMAGNGSALMLEACLSLHADANLPDNEGNTPLHFAAQAGQTECLNILLQRCPSIEVDARNSLGFTPLMKAALQGRTKCAKILLFAGANPTLRDHGRGLRAEQWARFCGRYVCAEVIERFARHRLLEKTTSCRWGSEPELAAQVLQGKLMPIPPAPVQPPSSGLKSKIRRVFRTSSSSEKSFSLVSQLTSAALCASSPVLPKPGDVSPVVKSLLRPLSVPQLRITLVAPQDIIEKTSEKCSHGTTFTEKIESSIVKPPRTKKKSK